MPNKKEIKPFAFVDNVKLHHKKRLKLLIDSVEALFNGSKAVTREDEQVLFKGMHACGYALTILVHGCAAGRRKKTLEGLYNRSKVALVDLNLGLIGDMRKKTRVAHGLDTDDLESEGNHTLHNAIVKFDPWRGYKFSTYGCISIKRGFLGLAKKRQRQTDRIVRLTARQNSSQFRPGKKSIDFEIWTDRVMEAVKSNAAGLNDKERYVIVQRLLNDSGEAPEILDSIGGVIGVCKERVRQIELSAIRKLRDHFGLPVDNGKWIKGSRQVACA